MGHLTIAFFSRTSFFLFICALISVSSSAESDPNAKETNQVTSSDLGAKKIEFMMQNVSTSSPWIADHFYARYDSLRRIGPFVTGNYALTLEDACDNSTEITYTKDENWIEPGRGYICSDGAYVLYFKYKYEP